MSREASFTTQSVPDSATNKRERWALCATFGFVGGTLLSIIGALMLAVDWILSRHPMPWHSALRITGTLMLISIAPLLLFAGYCLDRIEGQSHS